ncbi:MAG: hypothetical protein RL026_2433 [Pseudomonadota bacterium]|jgi:putative MATE family efflux protein
MRTIDPHRPIWLVFLGFLGPMMLANILQSLSGTLNNIYLGQMVGINALAAASAFFPLFLFLISFVMGLGSGSSVLIGQAWGAQQPERVLAVAGTTLSVGLLGGLVVALTGGFFAEGLLRALATPDSILPEATVYARIALLSMPGFFIFILATSILRGVGDMFTPLRALAVSTGISMLLTPALIKGWLGLPPMGVTAAAFAFVASFIGSLVWLALHLRTKGHALAPGAALLRHMRIDPAILRLILKIGVPTALQMVVMSLAEIALLSLVNVHGADATAAYGIGNQVLGYVQFPAMSIAMAASILGAQAIGAGHTERLGAITRAGQLINLAVTGTLLVLCYLFSHSIIGMYTGSVEATRIADSLLRIVLWSTLLFGAAAVFSGVMRSSGAVLAPTFLSIGCIVLVEVPTAYALSGRYGLDGVWMAYPATFAAMLVAQGLYYHLVWRRRRIARLI